MKLDEQLKSLFDEVGERCPYKLAQHLGITLHYLDLGEHVCGFYQNSPLGGRYIVLNSCLDMDEMQTTTYLLLQHHQAHGELNLSLGWNDISTFKRVERESVKYLRMVVDAFLAIKAKKQT
ncbi:MULTISPECIES: hypothetical protein [Paenibacillus]|uniref:Uncharacterized protein n=1 Tax=Paenibacillus ehimensis TaxID=79264 RepID=A0ABT8VI98_9BACL|nr:MULTISPECIES: hypothetical protein [Paenibacillus]MBU7319040.1 hypothetical protein [Paenibacillus oleatilyticus]MDO3680664.1 hypothetical protein [Paenibacillus ehimensis]